jgi:hypothetical protein
MLHYSHSSHTDVIQGDSERKINILEGDSIGFVKKKNVKIAFVGYDAFYIGSYLTML